MGAEGGGRAAFLGRLKRDLGALESYAAMIGMLVGAGIFRVTSVASERTGPGVILGYLLLAPAILATSVPYAVYVSTPLGREPGGEYAHLLHTFGGKRLAFMTAWLKLISYLGALAYLALALADYLHELFAPTGELGEGLREFVAIASLAFFFAVHAAGVRWFARLQVWMCAVLGVSIAVLVIPGLFAIHPENYVPFLPHGVPGLLAALPPLFFAFAGFEGVAHAAGEVRESTRRLPRVFLRGILAAAGIFLAMSVVAFGVLPHDVLERSRAPMAEAAGAYLPVGAKALVTLGGVFAVATSLNASMLVPTRLALVLARDELLPGWLGAVHERRGTPIPGLTATLAIAVFLILSRQLALALNIAVFALVLVYALHSAALLFLPFRNPELQAAATCALPLWVQRTAAVFSLLSMGALISTQLVQDVGHIRATGFVERFRGESVTSLELLALWGAVGLLLYQGSRGAGRRRGATP